MNLDHLRILTALESGHQPIGATGREDASEYRGREPITTQQSQELLDLGFIKLWGGYSLTISGHLALKQARAALAEAETGV